MAVLYISTCCFAIMLICGLLFQLLTAFIQNPHKHWNVERLLFALAQFADIRFAYGCYFELDLFSLQWHYLLFSIFCNDGKRKLRRRFDFHGLGCYIGFTSFSRSCGFIHNTVGMALYTDKSSHLSRLFRPISRLSRTLPRLASTRYTYFVLWTIHIVNVSEWTNKNTVVRDLDKFETITERNLNTILIMKIWLRNNNATPTRHKRTKRQTRFCNTKHQGFPQEKATATAWRISEDFAKRVSAKPRSAPCRLLRNWVCFMQRRAVVLRARTRAHLYQRLRHV